MNGVTTSEPIANWINLRAERNFRRTRGRNHGKQRGPSTGVHLSHRQRNSLQHSLVGNIDHRGPSTGFYLTHKLRNKLQHALIGNTKHVYMQPVPADNEQWCDIYVQKKRDDSGRMTRSLQSAFAKEWNSLNLQQKQMFKDEHLMTLSLPERKRSKKATVSSSLCADVDESESLTSRDNVVRSKRHKGVLHDKRAVPSTQYQPTTEDHIPLIPGSSYGSVEARIDDISVPEESTSNDRHATETHSPRPKSHQYSRYLRRPGKARKLSNEDSTNGISSVLEKDPANIVVCVPQHQSLRATTASSHHVCDDGDLVEKTFSGIVIPYPISQLLLEGRVTTMMIPSKTSRGFAKLRSRDWLWIVETHSKASKYNSTVLYNECLVVPADLFDELPKRPETSQIVGIVQFGDTLYYRSKQEFDDARGQHFIPERHTNGWCASTIFRQSWNVRASHRLQAPVAIEGFGNWGFLDPKTFSVKFERDIPRDPNNRADRTQTDLHGDPESAYYEIQQGAWCGMHAMNNLLGGPYVTKQDCRLMADHVARRLSGPSEYDLDLERGRHMNHDSGWLSIDVINGLGESLLGVHVSESPTHDSAVIAECQSHLGMFLNWNQQHWTVLKVWRHHEGIITFVHLNSIQGAALHEGMKTGLTVADVRRLFLAGKRRYESVASHVVSKTPGLVFPIALDVHGRRAHLPPEDDETPHDAPLIVQGCLSERTYTEKSHPMTSTAVICEPETLWIFTCNVDGLADDATYGNMTQSCRVRTILIRLLEHMPSMDDTPVMLLLQEVNDEMYTVVNAILCELGWDLVRYSKCIHHYFVVTAISPALVRLYKINGVTYSYTSMKFLRTDQQRHVVTVNLGPWSVSNVHAESNSTIHPMSVSKELREHQFQVLANRHVQKPEACNVVAGDLNMRDGDERVFLLEDWLEVTSTDVGWTYQKAGKQSRLDRCFYHAPSGVRVIQVKHEEILNVHKVLTDHKPLCIVLSLEPESVSDVDVTINSTSGELHSVRTAAKKGSEGIAKKCGGSVMPRSSPMQILKVWKNVDEHFFYRCREMGESMVDATAIASHDGHITLLGARVKQISELFQQVCHDTEFIQNAHAMSVRLNTMRCRSDVDEVLRELLSGTGIDNVENLVAAIDPFDKFCTKESPTSLDLSNDVAICVSLFRIWLRNAVADLMYAGSTPGSKRWLSELEHELKHPSGRKTLTAENGGSELLFHVPHADMFTSHFSSHLGIASEWDLPRPRGRNRSTMHRRHVGHDDGRGKVQWQLVDCDSSFQIAWSRFIWHSCVEHVGHTWSIIQQDKVSTPSGHLSFGSGETYTVQDVYSIVFAVPGNCNKMSGSEICTCFRCRFLARVRDEINDKLGVNRMSDPQLVRNHETNHVQCLTWVWENILRLIKSGGWRCWAPTPVRHEISSAHQRKSTQFTKEIPLQCVEAMHTSGSYKWGQYVVETDKGKEHARDLIQQQYKDACTRRATAAAIADANLGKRVTDALLQAEHAQKHSDKICSKGVVTNAVNTYAEGTMEFDYKLMEAKFIAETMHYADGTKNRLNVPILIVYPLPQVDDQARHQQWCQNMKTAMYAKLQAILAKESKEEKQRAFRKKHCVDLPNKVGDLTIVSQKSISCKKQKLQYAWKGHRVDVTPRKHRVAPPETVSATRQQEYLRESTPDRALRKMQEKLRQVTKKQTAGQVPSIMARRSDPEGMKHMVHPMQKLQTALNDEDNLICARQALEFLDSMYLFHCWNCDEEWPVFGKEWPQSGIYFVGTKAGKSEVLEKHGFAACPRRSEICSRCSQKQSYRNMFCKDNWQHLGPRHPAISSLTWYESQLISRVHAVMSVLTLTATGMLCFAGHVCNYYQKTLEWVHSLPAVLRDKQFFVVKRRRSTRAPAVSRTQKKPITANLGRLKAAILECIVHMPTVYAHSWINEEHLKNVTFADGASEREPDDRFDLPADESNDIFLKFEVFEKWMDATCSRPTEFPAGAVIWHTAKDVQTEDMRQISADTVWEFCYRQLADVDAPQQVYRTTHISAMIYHWWENAERVAVQSGESATLVDALFDDITDNVAEQLANALTDKDVDAIRMKWIRLKVHEELEVIHAEVMHQEEDCIVDVDITGGLMSNPSGLVATNERSEEVMLSAQQEAEQVAALYQEQLKKDIGEDTIDPTETESRTSAIMTAVRKLNRRWVSDMQNKLEAARSKQRTEHAHANWQKCAALDVDIADLKTIVKTEFDKLSTALAESCEPTLRQKAEDCMFQLSCLMGENVGIVENQSDMTRSKDLHRYERSDDLEKEYAAAVQNENIDRAHKIKEVMELQQEWENDMSCKNTEKAFHTLTRLRLARLRLRKDKPMVNPPELSDIIRDTDKEPYWIPGAFPTIFQNETGDPYNYYYKEPDLQLWGPHIMMSKGWAAQAHPTFLYWWLNMIQRRNANAAKKWFISENKDSVGWTAEDMIHTSI